MKAEHRERFHTGSFSVGILMILVAGCAADPWDYHDESLYQVLKDATPESLDTHLLLLEKIIKQAEENNVKPPPGVYAEYGYYLALLGKTDEGITYLEKEESSYPEAALFVSALKRTVSGEEDIFEKDGATQEEE